jgi:hypothetical protein
MRPHTKPTWLLISAILLLAILASACRLPFNVGGLGSQPDQEPLQALDDETTPPDPPADTPLLGQAPVPSDALVLIYALDQHHTLLSAYGYNLEQGQLVLPAGRYYAEVLRGDGQLFALTPLIVDNEWGGFGRVDFANQPVESLSQGGAQPEFTTLVRFLLGVDQARLTYFEIVSDGFEAPLYAAEFKAGWAEEEQLSAALDALGDEQAVVAAALAFLNRAESAAGRQAGHKGLASIPGQSLVEAVIGFFSIAREDNQKATQDILLISDHMTHQEKEEAFEVLQTTLSQAELSGLGNYDDFIEKVKQGQIADMRAVRRDLAQQGPLAGVMQTISPDMNRPGLEIIHQVGVTAIERGADLYVEINKTILTVTFPGMDEGFDVADQAEEWINYVHDTYQDPTGAIQGAAWDQFTDKVGSQIKDSILARFPDTPEEVAEELAGRIVEEMKTSLINLGESLQDVITAGDSEEGPGDITAPGTPGETPVIYEGDIKLDFMGELHEMPSFVELTLAGETVTAAVDLTVVFGMSFPDSGLSCTQTFDTVYTGQGPLTSPLSLKLELIDYNYNFEGNNCDDDDPIWEFTITLEGDFHEDGSFYGILLDQNGQAMGYEVTAYKVD